MKKFTLKGNGPYYNYQVLDENGELVGFVDTVTITITTKDLRPIVKVIKVDGSIEEGFIDNLSASGTVVPK